MRLALCSLVSLSRGGMAALQSAPRRALWVDTDAGFDDLLALGALSRDAALEVVTVGSGACETPLDGARRVARFLGALGRSDVMLVAASPASFMYPSVTCPLPPPTSPLSLHQPRRCSRA